MAKRESQGLQIALIVFVMVTVLFMVTTVLFWKSSDTAKNERDDFESRAAAADTEKRRMETENQDIKEKLLGYPPDTAYDQIEKDVTQIILAYGAGLREEQRNLMALPEQMAKALSDKNDRIKKLSDIEAGLKKQMETTRQMAESKVATAQGEQQKAIAQQQAESAKLQRDREQQLADQQKRDDDYRAAVAMVENEKKKKEAEIADQTTRLTSLGRTNDRLTEEIEQYKRATLTVPDGEIIWVNQQAQLVWINLGEADGVRSQMTFNVFDVDANNLARAKLKGRIEILRVVDEISSEARILSDELSNPIMSGDVIDSHIWQRGQRLRFALVGIMDVDEDGSNDRDLVKQLIEMNGGIVDAMMDDDGNQTGPMSVHTRYLIKGNAPPAKDTAAVKGYTDMLNQAQTLGVDELSYTQILDYIGYDGKERSVPMGKSARAMDFKAKPHDGVALRSTGSVSGLYDPKRPPFRQLEAEKTTLD